VAVYDLRACDEPDWLSDDTAAAPCFSEEEDEWSGEESAAIPQSWCTFKDSDSELDACSGADLEQEDYQCLAEPEPILRCTSPARRVELSVRFGETRSHDFEIPSDHTMVPYRYHRAPRDHITRTTEEVLSSRTDEEREISYARGIFLAQINERSIEHGSDSIPGWGCSIIRDRYKYDFMATKSGREHWFRAEFRGCFPLDVKDQSDTTETAAMLPPSIVPASTSAQPRAVASESTAPGVQPSTRVENDLCQSEIMEEATDQPRADFIADSGDDSEGKDQPRAVAHPIPDKQRSAQGRP
jgi:hypothetical protein